MHVLYPTDNSIVTSGVIELYTELRSGEPNWAKVFKRAWEIVGFVAGSVSTDVDVAGGAFSMHQLTAVDADGNCDCDGNCGQELISLSKKLDVAVPDNAVLPYRCGAMTPVRAKVNAKWLVKIAIAVLKLMPTVLPLFLGEEKQEPAAAEQTAETTAKKAR